MNLDSVLNTADVYSKVKLVESECTRLLKSCLAIQVMPVIPARDVEVVGRNAIPRRKGLSSSEGQAHLLHDLGNIELQAMELGLRTLYEYPNAPSEFRDELVGVVLDEARHLKLCLDAIENLGFKWGDWPVLTNLWTATASTDSLLDRVLIVHCYLEGSGLDSGEQILNRLSGVENPLCRQVVKTIADEEIGHVHFGLTWYRSLCQNEKINSSDDFGQRLKKLASQIPARTTNISESARIKAGFDGRMIEDLRRFKAVQSNHP